MAPFLRTEFAGFLSEPSAVTSYPREKLGVIAVQHGFGKDRRSVWTWPNPAMPASIVPILPIKNSGTHGTNGTHGAVNDLVEVEI